MRPIRPRCARRFGVRPAATCLDTHRIGLSGSIVVVVQSAREGPLSGGAV